jgi:hypothetical protein
MAYIVEFPLEDGGVLVVQAAGADVQEDGLGLASPTQERVKKAGETLESALAQVIPAVKVVSGKLRELSPDGLAVEFGLTLTAETGVVIAKGSAEVHFTVKLSWSKDDAAPDGEANGSSRT